MVRDDVHDRADTELARGGDQLLRLLERPEGGVDRPVVDDVVAVVGQGRRVPGVEPERVDAQLVQIREPRAHTGEVTRPVAVPVGEAPDVHLVDDRVPPPGLAGPVGRPRRGERLNGAGRGGIDGLEIGHAARLARVNALCKI
jgi:hypothetical protein